MLPPLTLVTSEMGGASDFQSVTACRFFTMDWTSALTAPEEPDEAPDELPDEPDAADEEPDELPQAAVTSTATAQAPAAIPRSTGVRGRRGANMCVLSRRAGAGQTRAPRRRSSVETVTATTSEPPKKTSLIQPLRPRSWSPTMPVSRKNTAIQAPIGLNRPGIRIAVPRKVAASAGRRLVAELVGSKPPMLAASRTPARPLSRPEKTNAPKRIRLTRTPASRATSRLAPTKDMCRPSAVPCST